MNGYEAVARAKTHHVRIFFVDEAAFRSDAHRGTTWGKSGETPVIRDSGGRFGFKLINAVSARGDMHFDVIEDRMDAETFIGFLLKLRHDAGSPVMVIADFKATRLPGRFVRNEEEEPTDKSE